MSHYCACDIKFYSLILLEVNAAKLQPMIYFVNILMSRFLPLGKTYLSSFYLITDTPKDFCRYYNGKAFDRLKSSLQKGKGLFFKLYGETVFIKLI